MQEVDEILKELKDRFGLCPPQVLWLYHLTRLRLFASAHHFTLLKFEKLTFTAEKQTGKTVVKKTLVLPKFKTPHELETHVMEALREGFGLRV
jgi:transcription-repair coupling factor (superfamily II helicase)